MPDQKQILLQTKLHRPSINRGLIVRARLLEQLKSGMNLPFTLVCAPAGFGKTTLVGTWLEYQAVDQFAAVPPLPSAWLSLDENDSDLNLFLRYFIAALRTVFKDACQETLVLLHARQQPPETVLFATFSNELNGLSGEVILVLDDYQFIRGKAVHTLLIELARHWPVSLHLVLISRIDPPMPLTNLRAKGMLSEIRTRDLRFTPQETADYLSQAKFIQLSEPVLHLLEERFEGWPAGLHLAALSLHSAGSQESVLSALSGKNPDIAGYLVDEVLTHQVSAIHSFLLKTSILDRFCASLCGALLGEIDASWNARVCLDWIESSELFITPLDDRHEWYRYHHLFQELLQHRLSSETTPDQVSDLHRRASAWFEDQGLIDEAIHHALAAGDSDLAARQMAAGLCDVINREDRQTLERWLRMLPEELIQQRPELLMLRAWSLEFTWRLNLQALVTQKVETLLDSEGWGQSLPAKDLQILHGQILAFRAQQAYFRNQLTQAIDLCQQVLTLLPLSWTFVRGGAMLYLGMAMQASGEAQAGERMLLDEYEHNGNKTDPFALLILRSLAFTYLNTGQLEKAGQIAQVQLNGAAHSEIAIMKNWADWFLGLVCYYRNDLQAAEQHFSQIVKNRYTAQITTYRDAVAGLALIYQIKGESIAEWQIVESISQFDLEQSGNEDERTRSLHARLLLLQGDIEGAGRWADTFTNPPPDQSLIWFEEPQVNRARILIARGGGNDLSLALLILDALREIAERTHNSRYQIEIQALRAVALDARGETNEADAVLKQAIELSNPGGFIRVFVDLGKPMQAMLLRLERQDYSTEAIRRILSAMLSVSSMGVVNPVSNESHAEAVHYPSSGISILVEPLTRRELEVLTLLREPLSNKEIAQKLSISHATVRRHTINIYGKLGVNRRWSAVAKAEELNILPPL